MTKRIRLRISHLVALLVSTSTLLPITMSVPCAGQVRLFSPSSEKAKSWSLAAWVIPFGSYSATAAFEDCENPLIIQPRIGNQLDIRDGDEIEFELVESGERFRNKVTFKQNMSADFVINAHAGVMESMSMSAGPDVEIALCGSGKKLQLPMQPLWAGMKIVRLEGTGFLYFDGESRNDPKGPAGYGYRVTNDEGRELVRGYGFYKSATSEEMKYAGLLEGLIWGLRMDFKKLSIRGDSEIVQQVTGASQVNEPRLQEYHDKITHLMQQARDEIANSVGANRIVLERITQEQNVLSNALVNLAIDLKEHATACNWNNICQQCERHSPF
jgi:ribonuclease HI